MHVEDQLYWKQENTNIIYLRNLCPPPLFLCAKVTVKQNL